MQALWTFSAACVQALHERRVQLSAQSCELLIWANALAGGQSGRLFGWDSTRLLSNTVFLMALRRMGVAITAYGVCSSFRDWAAEATTPPREVAEIIPAHTVENGVEAAYRQGYRLAKRHDLMEAWAVFCEGPHVD